MEQLKYNEIKSVFTVGDLHGNFKDISYILKTYDIQDSIIIFCGDIGMGFYKEDYYNQIFNKIKKELSKRNSYILFVRGNHDDNVCFNGNTYKYKRIRTLRDYSIISVNDEFNILTIGGAISIDRKDRLVRTERRALEYMRYHNCSYDEAFRKCPQEYWLNEQPFYQEDKLNEIKENNIKINAVCTHTCPHFCTPYTKDGIRGWLVIDNKLEEDLNNERQIMTNIYEKLIGDEHPLSIWCYGHFHFHNTEIIDNVKFNLLDMDRNGRMDMIKIYEYENIIP